MDLGGDVSARVCEDGQMREGRFLIRFGGVSLDEGGFLDGGLWIVFAAGLDSYSRKPWY